MEVDEREFVVRIDPGAGFLGTGGLNPDRTDLEDRPRDFIHEFLPFAEGAKWADGFSGI